MPPGQRPLEGFLAADEAEAVGLPLTKGDRLALDATSREAFDRAASRRSREELMRSGELSDAIFTGVNETREAQQSWLTSRIAQELGDPTATNLTPAARQRIRGDVQSTFKKYFDDAPVRASINDMTNADMAKMQDVADVPTPNAERVVRQQVDKIENHRLSGREHPDDVQQGHLAEKRSDLADRSEEAGDYELGSNLSQLREVVEDVLERQYKGDDIATNAIRDARKRWRVLKALERTNATDPAGDINPRSFLNAYKAVTPRYKRLTRASRGDLEAELETLNWLTTKVQPDSGTAQRLLSMMGRPLPLGGGAALGGYPLFGD